ncbi:hypothetical protein UA08_08304 [Talaromyces atroroseus]|uniref:Uncharacterized protein n=1 Tax=Talaromyces atroroseus TaxID=1441469 RepID=A0A225ANJ1_TALAT|nr:hypothetical protein UA08_08304 [Talaromyces atroroseus]OKL56516.1 hypothetical protein UA08_08304 [Talaromyces atroroseus]
MKSVYTAIPLALLAAVAQAELHLSGQHKQSRDVGLASDGGHDFLGDSSEDGDFLGDTHDHDFFGNGFDHPKNNGPDTSDFESSWKNSAIGGPHNFNQQNGGPYTDSGHNEIDDGINSDNIVITQVSNQQAEQATEGTYITPEPDHPQDAPSPPAEHQPEQLPPQQHSDPKQAVPETVPSEPETVPTKPETPVDTSEDGGEQEPPCPESEDGTHHMPMPMPEDSEAPDAPKETPKPQPEVPIDPQIPAGKGNSYPPPHPPAQQSHPQPHEDAEPFPEEHELPEPDHEKDQYHGTYPPPKKPQDGIDSAPVPEEHDLPEPDHEKDHYHGAYPPPKEPEDNFDLSPVPEEHETEPETYKPFPPGPQYGKPQSHGHVTPSSTFKAQIKASQAPSSVHHASYQASIPPSVSIPAKPTTTAPPPTLITAPSIALTPTPTVPSPLSVPSPFLGGAGFVAAPQGFTLAVLGALAFLL